MMLEIAKYGIGTWDSESWGNHRAVLEVDEKVWGGDTAVCALLPWRRRDKDAHKKGIFVRFGGGLEGGSPDFQSSQSSQNFQDSVNGAISNVLIRHFDRERGEIIFEPSFGAGIYEVYYMVYGGQTRAPYPVIHYLPPRNFADSEWSARALEQSETLPEAKLLRMEACDELHSFYPMEVIASRQETERLCEQHQDSPFLLFGEGHERAIRMDNFLPVSWVREPEHAPFQPLRLRAAHGEYLCFQVGVYAHKNGLRGIEIEWDGCAAEFTCFNLGGTDCYGQEFRQRVHVAHRRVQAFWCGLQLEPQSDKSPASSHCHWGMLRIRTETGEAAQLPIEIEWLDESVSNHGDDEPQRMSRLRWLNSTLGSEQTVTKPFTPVRQEGRRLHILGREIELDSFGLPRQISSYFSPELTHISTQTQPLLSDACRFVVRQSGKDMDWEGPPLSFGQTDETLVGWSRELRQGNLNLLLEGSLEFDGCLTTLCRLSSLVDMELDDVLLRLPLAADIVKYRLGLGYEGCQSQQAIDWKWDVAAKSQDSLWLGKENAGLQVSLRDENYRRPLNTNFYRQQ
ncbi:MAG: glycoside hydrolase domain-containing protein, partial [Spirochaetota bacterium]